VFRDFVAGVPEDTYLPVTSFPDIILPRLCRSGAIAAGPGPGRGPACPACQCGNGAAHFGYPQAHEHDAERAVRAGLALVEAVPKLATAAGSPLQVRVGIAAGLVIKVATISIPRRLS
jgi:hypothetical protein